MRKKVLFFAVSKRELSGGQTMILNALKNIDNSKFDVELLVQSECPLSQKAQSEGIRVHFLPFPKMLKDIQSQRNNFIVLLIKKIMMVLTLLFFSLRTFVFVRKHKYDVVWCENIKVLLSVALLKFSRVKLVFNMWSMVNSNLGLKLVTLISNHIVVEGFFQKKLFANKKAPPISVIYTQIDKMIFKNSQKNKRRETNKTIIGFLGGCRYSKGYDIFVETAHELVVKQGLTNLFFYVAGASQDDDFFNNKELSIKIDELADNIQIKEWIDDKELFYGHIDIFISTSRSEGLPGAVREAMGFGLPVIATDVGGTQEALANTGIIISEKEKEKIILQLGNNIKDLTFNERKSYILGSAAQKRASTLFVGDNWVDELEGVFYKL